MEKLSNLPLFAGMEEAGCQQMLECFHTGPRSFRAGETAYTYGGSSGRMLGILQSGCAALVKIDADGGRTVLERLGPGGVFGELIAFASLPCDSVTVVCEADCVIVFLPQAQLASCGKSCACHRQLLENLLSLISQKAFALSERVEVLSCRSTREKLLCYFRIRAGEEKSLSFSLPFTLRRPGGVSVCGPQRHDAGTEKAAGGRVSGSQREAGAVSFRPAFRESGPVRGQLEIRQKGGWARPPSFSFQPYFLQDY